MSDNFDYGPFLVTYDADHGSYYLVDVNYGMPIGTVEIVDGPGAVLELNGYLTFLDSSIAHFLGEFLQDVNSTIDSQGNPT